MSGSDGDGRKRDDGAERLAVGSQRFWTCVANAYLVAALVLAVYALFLFLGVIDATRLAPATDRTDRGWLEELLDFTLATPRNVGPAATLTLAVVTGAMLAPVVLIRARLQAMGIDATRAQIEQTRRDAEAALNEQRWAASRQEQTTLRLRATEMLGAVDTEQVFDPPRPPASATPDGGDIERIAPLEAARAPALRSVLKPNMETRVAAISILEEVARTRDARDNSLRNHVPVIETLLAYVRTVRAQLGEVELATSTQGGEDSESWLYMIAGRAEAMKERLSEPEQAPREDVKAVATVLRRRNWAQLSTEAGDSQPEGTGYEDLDENYVPGPNWTVFEDQNAQFAGRIEKNRRLLSHPRELRKANENSRIVASAEDLIAFAEAQQDWIGEWQKSFEQPAAGSLELNETPLYNCNFSGIKLRRARVPGAHFEGAVLRSAECAGLDAPNARLHLADLREADLEGSDLRGIQAISAIFNKSSLIAADLRGGLFQYARFNDVNAAGTRWMLAHLERATAKRSRFDGAEFAAVFGQEAVLSGSTFFGALLDFSTFRNADLSFTWLAGASFDETVVHGATLVGAQLFRTNESGAHGPPSDAEVAAFRSSGAAELAWGEVFGDRTLSEQLKYLTPWFKPPDDWSDVHLHEHSAEGEHSADMQWAAWREARALPTLPQHSRLNLAS